MEIGVSTLKEYYAAAGYELQSSEDLTHPYNKKQSPQDRENGEIDSLVTETY
jgi:hypothetical protein